jgi:hypothetical protein
MLQSLRVSIETEGRIYEISTEQSPLRGLISSRGIAWSRAVFRLPEGVSIEQQMMLPQGGGAAPFA